MDMKLGRLEKVRLSDAWGSDSGEFLRWLGEPENLTLLGAALGRDLRPADDVPAELARVAALCCRDAETGALVLADVGFEAMSDERLGRLMCDAAGYADATLVWLAPEVPERQQAAIAWINSLTQERPALYALEVTFWQIGTSALAPTLTIVSKPAQASMGRPAASARRGLPATPTVARPTTVSAVPAAGVTTSAPTALAAANAAGTLQKPSTLFLEYWLAFNGNLIQRKSMIIGQKPTAANWMSFPMAGPNFNLVATVNNRDHFIAVALVLTGPDAKAHFHLLQHSKTSIETEIGAALEWQELPERPESRVLLRRFGVEPENRKQWHEQHDWLVDKLERFQRAFALRVETLNADDDTDHLVTVAPVAASDDAKPSAAGGMSAGN